MFYIRCGGFVFKKYATQIFGPFFDLIWFYTSHPQIHLMLMPLVYNMGVAYLGLKVGHVGNQMRLKGTQHTFENAGFKTKFGKLRWKYFGLDINLTLRSLVGKLVSLFLRRIVHFQVQIKTMFLDAFERLKTSFFFHQSWKWMGLTKRKGQTLKPSSLKLGTCKCQNTLPWLTKLHFKTNIIK